jgi:hypothetical protein
MRRIVVVPSTTRDVVLFAGSDSLERCSAQDECVDRANSPAAYGGECSLSSTNSRPNSLVVTALMRSSGRPDESGHYEQPSFQDE